MRYCCLLLLTAALVGLASIGTGLEQLGQAPALMVVAPAEAIPPELPGTALPPAAPSAPADQLPAAAAAALTVALGLVFRHLSGLAGLLLLSSLAVAIGVIAPATAIAPAGLPGPLLLAGLVAYGVGVLGSRGVGGERPDAASDRDQQELMPKLARSSCAAILTFDGEGFIRSYNPAVEKLFGYAGSELSGMPFRLLLAGPEQHYLRLPVRAEGTTCQLTVRRKSGQCVEVGAALSTMDLNDGRVRLVVLQDSTELVTSRQALPLRDQVTGLPHRALFADRIDQAVLAAERAGQPLAVLIVHLKLFKTLKETLSDAFADQLLLGAVGRLRESLRRSDTLARIADAELGLLLPGPTDAALAAQMAQWMAYELSRPSSVEGLQIGLDVNIGIATYPQHGRKTHELLQRAEVAMLDARRSQRAIGADPPPAGGEIPQELILIDELREAVEAGHLFLEFLPKLSLQTNRPDGVEALVRWRHPTRGAISAGQFAAVAAEHGMMLPVTLRVLSLAIGHQRAWRAKGIEFTVAVNLSSDCICNPQFIEITDQVLKTSGGNPSEIVFEITENMLAQDPTKILAILKSLAGKGYQLALDDFATGSLSLAFLQKLPITELKIDRSFVAAMARDQDAAAVVRSALSLGQSLGLRVVAEGVEDQETLELLRQLGCPQVQGYLIGPPMTADQFEQWQEAFGQGAPADRPAICATG